jgi:hypothetical protein
VLLEPRALQRGYFRPQSIRKLVDEHLRGRRDRSGLLWRLLVFELWHRNFLESGNAAAETTPDYSATVTQGAGAGWQRATGN